MNFKKTILFIPLLLSLTSCTYTKYLTNEYTSSEIIAIYDGLEDYELTYYDYKDMEAIDFDEHIYIVSSDNLEANFYFFSSQDKAYLYMQEHDFSLGGWMISIFSGDSSITTYEQIGKMVVSYIDYQILNPILEYESNI